MRNHVMVLSLALSAMVSATALADHATENAGATAQLAYRLADTAERLERFACMNLGPQFNGLATKEAGSAVDHIGGDEVLDHQEENLGQLSMVARRLHLAASDLYRAARSGGGFGPNRAKVVGEEGGSALLDHDERGDSIRNSYARTRFEYQNLRQYYANLAQYNINPNIHYLMRDINQAFINLEWTVNGIRN